MSPISPGPLTLMTGGRKALGRGALRLSPLRFTTVAESAGRLARGRATGLAAVGVESVVLAAVFSCALVDVLEIVEAIICAPAPGNRLRRCVKYPEGLRKVEVVFGVEPVAVAEAGDLGTVLFSVDRVGLVSEDDLDGVS